MGTGISMSSVNKIKELAESGDYSLALDILDHQDLTKSLSPQFIRICGEVYYENQRYPEARAALVKAHSMAPMGNKIVFSLIQLYLSMGFYQLAEKYFEIYQFNQNARDAGTLRIEYLIARAKRKPIIELYSILLSANGLETDERWDFEMLLLHAAMNNMDKLEADGEMFRATYKSSVRLNDLDALLTEEVDVKSMLYCFPEEEIVDTDPDQQETREFEEKVLQEDELRMHPNDPKIMIMVEDDEPIPNSVKFRHMLSRSKERKEEKREKKKMDDQSGEKTGLFGRNRISRKEEEVIEEVLSETTGDTIDKEKLLDEIVSESSNDQNDQMETTVEVTDNPEMVELIDETTPEDKAMYHDDVDAISEKSFEDAMDDFDFQDEEEIEAVVMVDAENFKEAESEITEAAEEFEDTELETTEVVEAFEEAESDVIAVTEEFEEYDSDVTEIAEEIEEIKNEMSDLEVHSDEIEFEVLETEEIIEENGESEIEAANSSPVNTDSTHSDAEEGEDAEFAEKAEAAEGLNEFKEAVLISENEDVEQNESTFDDEFNSKADQDDFDIDFAIQSIDDYKMNLFNDEIVMVEDDVIEKSEPIVEEEPESMMEDEVELVFEEESEPVVENEPESIIEDEFNPVFEEESEPIVEEEPESIMEDEFESVFEEESEPIDEEAPESIMEDEFESVFEEESELIVEEEPESIIEDEFESVFEEKPEPIVEEESKEITIETALSDADVKSDNDVYNRKLDFPIFKTSLFPDYNRDEPPVIQPISKPKVEINKEKINENLKKEEDLLNETDKLLASLGIEIGTNSSPGISASHDDEDNSFLKGYKRSSGNDEDNGFSLKKN